MKTIASIMIIILISSCQEKITEKQQKYLDQIYVYELDEYYSHTPMNVDFIDMSAFLPLDEQEDAKMKARMEKIEFENKYGTLMKANDYFDKSRFVKDSLKSKVLLDSSIELYRIAYTDEGISSALGNSIANKLFMHMETEAIDELLMLEAGNLKSSDGDHVYQLWSKEKIFCTLSYCYLKNRDFDKAKSYQLKLEKLISEKNYGLSGQINNLYLKSVIEIVSGDNGESCATLNKRIDEIDKEMTETLKESEFKFNFIFNDAFKNKFEKMKALYNNFCLAKPD